MWIWKTNIWYVNQNSYNPHKNLIVAHLREIQVALDVLSSKYENIIIFGDFNSESKNLL